MVFSKQALIDQTQKMGCVLNADSDIQNYLLNNNHWPLITVVANDDVRTQKRGPSRRVNALNASLLPSLYE